jgi:hypothetical protein
MKNSKCIKITQAMGALVCAMALYMLWKNQDALIGHEVAQPMLHIYISGIANALVGLIVGFSMLQNGNLMNLRERISKLEKQVSENESHTPR